MIAYSAYDLEWGINLGIVRELAHVEYFWWRHIPMRFEFREWPDDGRRFAYDSRN